MNPANLAAVKGAGVRLLEQHPEIADDLQLKLDTLEGETDVIHAFNRMILQTKTLRVEAEALKELAGEIIERSNRKLSAIASIRDVIEDWLSALDLPSVKTTAGTASFGAARQAVIITDEKALPEAFIRVKREPDRSALLDALKSGQAVPGASLSNGGQVLTIR